MSEIAMKMTAVGCEGDCCGCITPFTRGQQMTAVTEGDESLGWFCDDCITSWDETIAGTTHEERIARAAV